MSKHLPPPGQTCPRCAGSGVIVPKGSVLRVMRDAAGFSQGVLARRLNVSVPFISRVENDHAACPARLYEAYLAEAAVAGESS